MFDPVPVPKPLGDLEASMESAMAKIEADPLMIEARQKLLPWEIRLLLATAAHEGFVRGLDVGAGAAMEAYRKALRGA